MLMALVVGDDVFEKESDGRLRKGFQVGSEDKNDRLFLGQRHFLTERKRVCLGKLCATALTLVLPLKADADAC